jgi:Icc-related predicted phosphoesterase
VIRVAAIGDVHVGTDSVGTLRPHLADVNDDADVLLVAGDLTRVGTLDEARVLLHELEDVHIPVVAVLGNHDHHSDRAHDIVDVLGGGGIRVLEGETSTLDLPGGRLGIAGAKGFGGGFVGACATDFGEPEMKAFVRHTQHIARGLEHALCTIDADVRIALLHYSPIEATLQGERLEIYPFLGSYLLGEAVDAAGADLVVHGHAHAGAERGHTPCGIPVRNVAQPVIKTAYQVFAFDGAPTELRARLTVDGGGAPAFR